MRYVAALSVLLLCAAAATPADAGPGHRHERVQGHGGHGHHNNRGHRHDMDRPHYHGPRGHHRLDGPRVMRPHRAKPLGWILRGIRRSHPGRLSDVRPAFGPNGEPHLRVKWLTPDGRVLWLRVDARTGEVLDVRGRRH